MKKLFAVIAAPRKLDRPVGDVLDLHPVGKSAVHQERGLVFGHDLRDAQQPVEADAGRRLRCRLRRRTASAPSPT